MGNRSVVRLFLLQIVPRVIRHVDRERAASAGPYDPLVEDELLPAVADRNEMQIVRHSQTDESRCHSSADVIASNRAHANWAQISAALLLLLLVGPSTAFAADSNGFWLSFPLLGKTPDNVEINAVFDRYRPYGDYCPDGIVRTMGGMQGSNGAGRASSWSSQPRSNCTGPLGNTLYGYTLDSDPAATRDIVLSRGIYTGGGDTRHLYYDSHPGYDFRVGYGTTVYASSAGVVSWTSSAAVIGCNPLEIDHGNGYKSIYLHLSARTAAPGTHVSRGDPIGSSGDACAPGAPHLHFELRYLNVPTDPYDPNENGAFDLWTPPASCSTPVGIGASNAQRFTDAYTRNGGQPTVGCPTNTVHGWGNGTIQDFTGGTGGTGGIMLADGASTAWLVQGTMWTKYVSLGGVNFALGYPASDVSGLSTASTGTQLSYQQFQGNGALEWHRSGARNGQVYEVHGAIYTTWTQIGFAAWWGGMPIADEKAAPTSPQGHIGRVSDFERGHIWWLDGAAAAFETHGSIDAAYMIQNGPGGCLGFALTNEFVNGSGRAQNNFENGYITTLDGVNYQIFCGTVTGVPPTPSNFRVTGTTTTTASLGWDDVAGESGYRIYKWNGSSFPIYTTLGPNVTTYTDSGLSCNTQYFYEVSAYNAVGESAQTAWIVSTTSACPLTKIISLIGNLTFGNVTVNTTATATLTISNSGNSTLTVSGINYPTGFSGNWSNGTIAAGASQNVTVTFAPTAATSYGGTATVASDRTSGTNTIAVSGTGTITPTRIIGLTGNLAFGNVTVNTTATATLTISNSGNSTLTVSGISYPTGFSGNWSNGTIGAGASQNVTVTFAPTAATSYGGTVAVASDRTSGTNAVAASGTGTTTPTRIIGLSGNLTFGNVTVNTTPTATLTISNSGNSTLTVSGISYPTGFSGSWSNGTIGAGASQSVTVTFAPTAATSYGGTVTVTSDRTTGTNTISASGAGTVLTPFDFDGDARADMTLYKSNGDWAILTSTSGYTASTVKNWGGAGYTAVPGDYDGDGKQDLGVYREATGDWLVLTSRTNYTTVFSIHLGGPGYVPVPGHHDGDGKTDPAVYQPSSGWWFILKSSTGYTDSTAVNWGGPGYTAVPGQDFDGDRRSDLIVYQQVTGQWLILRSSANFTTTISVNWGGPGYTLVPGDYDGDGKADFGLYRRSTGWWSVLKSSTGYTTTLSVNWGGVGYLPVPGDYDGDGKIDLGVCKRSTGDWYVLKSSTTYTTSLSVSGWGAAGDMLVTSAIAVGGSDTMRASDVDGDGKSDITVYNPTTTFWSTLTSSTSYTGAVTTSWGGAGYTPVPGDFDGDGKADLGIYQQATGNWYVLLSSTGFTTTLSKSVGGPGWAPVAGDYDGDGKTDFVVYNTSTGLWYGLRSSTGYTTTLSVSWGGSGYTAAPGDFDGDGKTDLAVYQQTTGNWSVLLSAGGYTTALSRSVGGAGYMPVQGDYDGDGKTDFVVYNAATGLWYGLKSSTSYTTTVSVGWGGAGYAPVHGDYDGDGKIDLAIYQTSTGTWSILFSRSGYMTALTKGWGGVGYTPVPSYP